MNHITSKFVHYILSYMCTVTFIFKIRSNVMNNKNCVKYDLYGSSL